MQRTEDAPSRPLYGTQNRHQRRIYRWRTQDEAYINRYDHARSKKPIGRSELYAKDTDYLEQSNLFKQQPAKARRNQEELTEFVTQQEKDRDPAPVTTIPNIDAMKALGYIE